MSICSGVSNRIVAGGRSYYDREGRLWGSDRHFIGGRPFAKPTVVRGTSDPELYGNERWGHFSYSIPVASPGRYKVTLKFAGVREPKKGTERTIPQKGFFSDNRAFKV